MLHSMLLNAPFHDVEGTMGYQLFYVHARLTLNILH